jgi:hypothetical protein
MTMLMDPPIIRVGNLFFVLFSFPGEFGQEYLPVTYPCARSLQAW